MLKLKDRLDCDSQRCFSATLEAKQTRRTDLWVFTMLVCQSLARLLLKYELVTANVTVLIYNEKVFECYTIVLNHHSDAKKFPF